MNLAVEIKELSHHYGERKALDAVSFQIEKNKIFAVLGPNGGGKTTLFRTLSTDLSPTQGTAEIFGSDILKSPAEVRKKIGVVFQTNSLDKKLTVQENLKFSGTLYGLSGKSLQIKVDEVLDRLKLKDRLGDFVEDLSGGLARRVDLAKSLLHDPQLIMLDEPSTGLDPGARRDLRMYLEELCSDKGISILLTTHLMDEADHCHQLAILNQGKLVSLGTPNELKSKVSGDVITLTAENAETLSQSINQKLQLESKVVNDAIRIEKNNAHEWIPRIVEAFSGQFKSVTLSKPTLEDVFIRETGHQFWNEVEEPVSRKKRKKRSSKRSKEAASEIEAI